jgi:hypothetical protein
MSSGAETTSRPDGADNVVAIVRDPGLDKYALLERVLTRSRFWETLERAQHQSGKDAPAFCIAIKPNLSMMLRRSDVGTYTDPFLLVHLLRLLILRGYTNLVVVETQNLYGNWFLNRRVLQVAARAGLTAESVFESADGLKSADIVVRGGGVDARVPLVDMSLDKVMHDCGDPIGAIELGRAWTGADFRVSFAKMKTHFYSAYTLGIKNVYGCLPLQDKVSGYHCKKAVGKWTAAQIRDFPVHFSIVDGFTAADGWLGVKMKAVPAKPHLMFAGADLMAVDHFGARIMRVKPGQSILYRHARKILPQTPYQVAGDAAPVKGWRKCPQLLCAVSIMLEANADIMNLSGSLATGGYDPCFPHQIVNKGPVKRALFHLTLPFNIMLDLGVVRLRLREKIFARRLCKHRGRFPMICASDAIVHGLTFLAPEDLVRLAALLDHEVGLAELSGHYLIHNGSEYPFPARLSTANLAARDVLTHAAEKALDKKSLARELEALGQDYAQIFPGDQKYAYCYR